MDGQWSSSLIWGGNVRDGETLSNSILAESELSLDGRNSIVVRGEYVQKSAAELVLDVAPFNFAPEMRFGVSEFSLGYVRELASLEERNVGTRNSGDAECRSLRARYRVWLNDSVGCGDFHSHSPAAIRMGAMEPMDSMSARTAATQTAPPPIR